MDNLFARREHQFIHIFDKPLDIQPANLAVVLAGEDAPVLDTFDMLTGNTDVEHLDVYVGQRRSLFDCLPDAVYGLLGSEEHTSELQSLMRISYAVFCSIQTSN